MTAIGGGGGAKTVRMSVLPAKPKPVPHPGAATPTAQHVAAVTPPPPPPQTVQQQAQASLNPVIQLLTQQIQNRALGQQQALAGYTNQLVQNLAGMAPSFSAPYQQAEGAVAASNQALADRLAAGGQAAGADLSSRLASINAPGAVDPTVAAAQQAGAGAGNSLYASGNAALQQLAANAANAGSYGAKLPGIATLGAIQQAGRIWGQAQSDTAQQVGQLETQLPSIVQSIQQQQLDQQKFAQQQRADAATAAYRKQSLAQTANYHNRTIAARNAATKSSAASRAAALAESKRAHQAVETQRRIDSINKATNDKVTALIAEGFDPATGNLTPKAQAEVDRVVQAGEAAAERARHARVTEAQAGARIRTAQTSAATASQNAAEHARHDRATEATARYKATHPGVKTQVISDKSGQWLINKATGDRIAKVGGPKSTGTPKTQQQRDFPNLSKTQVTHLRSGIANAFYGVPEQKDVNGNVTRKALPPVDYQTAIRHAVRAGYSRAGATKMANRFYMPGKRGRPKK